MAGGMITTGPGGRTSEYEKGKVTFYVVVACLIGACTGLVFGYDIGIAGGVISFPEFQEKFFPEIANKDHEVSSDPYCKYDDPILQLFVSCLFLAGIVGAFLASFTCAKCGRKWTMIIGGNFFLIGAIVMAVAVNTGMLIFGRVMLGLGVGVSVQSGPLFLSELAPYHLRGLFNTLFQLFITFGILAAQLINYGTQFVPYGWHISLGLAGLPALLLILGSLMVPDTPNSLVDRGYVEEARATLIKIRGTDNVNAEMEDIIEAGRLAKSYKQNQWRVIFSRQYLPQLVINIALPIFNQLDGINSVMFYAPQLFSSLGSGMQMALLMHVIIGVVNVVTTFVAVFTVDSLGRRFWLIQGGLQMMAAMIAMGAVVATQMTAAGTMSHAAVIGLIVIVCFFIPGHAWGWGPIPWLMCSEVQPLHTRPAGTALNTVVNFLLSFVIGQCFLSMLCKMKWGVFYFFAGWLLFMVIFTYFLVPETKGVPIEAIDQLFKDHWVWGKVIARNATAAGSRRVTRDDDTMVNKDTVKVKVTFPQPDAVDDSRKKPTPGGNNM
eukprot:jgi/Chrzof1/12141/Cz06g22210.t1